MTEEEKQKIFNEIPGLQDIIDPELKKDLSEKLKTIKEKLESFVKRSEGLKESLEQEVVEQSKELKTVDSSKRNYFEERFMFIEKLCYIMQVRESTLQSAGPVILPPSDDHVKAGKELDKMILDLINEIK